MRRFATMLCLAIAGVTGAALGQTPADACADERYRAFDFWLGTWEVTDGSGAVQGINKITAEENGCLILERWTSANGGTGQSYNYIDMASGKWRQVWVSFAATIDYEGGLTETGSMRLEGTIAYRNGTSFPFTGEWTPQADGSVRQYFEQYDPEADQWNPWFLGIYRKVEGDTGG